ncbi:beta-galactosidase [Kitasatospora cineracea]|uniref:beta-galactosidase n=1 Tax=Kitasatospora cineracea TaxID=88074 RepID=A0A8G1UM91_9ACTN|nr:beta-galactosidase [Kitasatospora cineracea]ROR46546.1 beta-galactosidase [Kitasatospora cineracea]
MTSTSRLPRRTLFGAAYYAEYHRGPRVAEDFDRMVAAGFNVIRVGESVWSTWEPEDGRFELDWLQPVLDHAHERGIQVILGTPTYAVPPWLARRYPEINGETSTGSRVGWGARQEVDFTHAAFRFHAERVIRAIMERHLGHPAVIGVQLDNEPGYHLLHNHGVFQRFVEHLRHRYRDVETLNREWGLVYWSHRLSDWSDLWRPDGNAQPQYDLAWRRFQAEQTAEFIRWQADIVRGYSAPDQFVTTCIAYELPAMHDERVSRELDITSGNAYYGMQDALLLPHSPPATRQWFTSGVHSLHLTADRMYASRQAPFLVTETTALTVNDPGHMKPAYDGQWRQAAWTLVARGARMIGYWHWHTLHFGTETYWSGVLPHSGVPGRAYGEIARLGAEFAAAGDKVADLTPHSDVTFLYSTASKWLMQKQPPLGDAQGQPDNRAYREVFDAFYRGAFDARLQAGLIHDEQILDGTPGEDGPDPVRFAQEHPLLVAVGAQVAERRLLDWLTAYAAAGGHLLLGPRTGYTDEEGRARDEVAPPVLSGPAGTSYSESSNLDAEIPLTAGPDDGLHLPTDAAATRWVDGLVAGDAQILAGYRHPHHRKFAAVTTRQHGDGRITCVGSVPNPSFAKALFTWARPAPMLWDGLPESVTVNSATNPQGRRVHVLHNWSWEPRTVTTPIDLDDVLSDRKFPAGNVIPLGPWDVVVTTEL